MGRPAELSRERIVAEALVLLDEAGVAGLTMRGLATRLGVKAASLYHHVRGLDDLVVGMQDAVNSDIDVALLDDDSADGLAGFARSYRTAYQRHPAAADLVSRRPLTAPTAFVVYDALAAHLVRRGLPDDEVLPVMAALDFVVLGSAGETLAEDLAAAPAALLADRPHLARAMVALPPTDVDDAAFELSLRLLTAAVEERLVSARASR